MCRKAGANETDPAAAVLHDRRATPYPVGNAACRPHPALSRRLPAAAAARMIAEGIAGFAGRRVLLLQGPVGPFFARLAHDLAGVGAQVFRIDFNGGDRLFRPPPGVCSAQSWRGTMDDWPHFLRGYLIERQIDLVLLFGDCRPIHRAAIAVAKQLRIDLGVFEEGYLRPDFITLERGGVNGYSAWLGRLPDPAATLPDLPVQPMPRSFWPMVLWGFGYFAAAAIARPWFRHYRHHRPIGFAEALPWARSPLRKLWHSWRERGVMTRLTGPLSGRFFLVPLQVHNDAQVHFHADVGGVEGFIERVIASFGRSAPADAWLVIKHHPLDRGYRDHTRRIARAAAAAGCAARVIAIHDQHMPTILPHCRGTVVINSTAGLAAIGCGRPTIALGSAIYRLPGLTYPRSLERFWTEAADHPPDPALHARFRAALIARTQINGNFYRRLDRAGLATGLVWPPRPAPTTVVPFMLGDAMGADAPPPARERVQP